MKICLFSKLAEKAVHCLAFQLELCTFIIKSTHNFRYAVQNIIDGSISCDTQYDNLLSKVCFKWRVSLDMTSSRYSPISLSESFQARELFATENHLPCAPSSLLQKNASRFQLLLSTPEPQLQQQ